MDREIILRHIQDANENNCVEIEKNRLVIVGNGFELHHDMKTILGIVF